MRRKIPAMLMAVGKVAVRPKSLLFALFVAALVFTFIQLSQWQWGRHVSRNSSNNEIRTALAAPPVRLQEILARPATPMPADADWRKVNVRGHYDTAHQLLVRYRDYGDTDEAGYEVLTPLVTSTAPIWVDRGWVPAGTHGRVTSMKAPTPPAPPSGTVTVTGYLRQSEPAVGQVAPEDRQVRSIYLPALDQWYGRHTYDAYLSRIRDQPAAPKSPRALPTQKLGGGPYLAYSIQWLLFAAIAVGGWIKLMGDDVVAQYTGKPKQPRARSGPPRPGGRGGPAGPRPVGQTSADHAEHAESEQNRHQAGHRADRSAASSAER